GDTGVFHWNGEAWTPTSLGVAIAPARIVGIGGTLRAVLGSMILARPLD
ncbi:MAG: hypothetical protein FJ098_14540, partial [Deltaproteobacteria bacterium]|nr:hypothetical protein [Deltaproteobacteria bacterium]